MKIICARVATLLAIGALLLPAQAPKQPPGPKTYPHPPDLANVRYGPRPRDVFDLFKAKSSQPAPLVVYYYPGGFTLGDKTWIDPKQLDDCLRAGFSVATVNYPYSFQSPYPVNFEDSARALQFLRLHAGEYGLDPARVAVTGASAGAVISLWIAFHNEMADPRSPDPVNRQSTRVLAAGVVDGQSSMDPRVVAKLLDERTARIKALATLYGIQGDVFEAKDKFPLFEDASPITHLTRDDPPVFLYYGHDVQPLPTGDRWNQNEMIHNPRFGLMLKEKMDPLGIECVLRTRKDYPDATRGADMYREMTAFFARRFQK
jgi:acetyl esterase